MREPPVPRRASVAAPRKQVQPFAGSHRRQPSHPRHARAPHPRNERSISRDELVPKPHGCLETHAPGRRGRRPCEVGREFALQLDWRWNRHAHASDGPHQKRIPRATGRLSHDDARRARDAQFQHRTRQRGNPVQPAGRACHHVWRHRGKSCERHSGSGIHRAPKHRYGFRRYERMDAQRRRHICVQRRDRCLAGREHLRNAKPVCISPAHDRSARSPEQARHWRCIGAPQQSRRNAHAEKRSRHHHRERHASGNAEPRAAASAHHRTALPSARRRTRGVHRVEEHQHDRDARPHGHSLQRRR